MQHAFLNIATVAARKAGQIIIRGHERLDKLKVSQKAENDFVTQIDQQCEVAIIEEIRQAYPDHGILAEESGQSDGKDKVRWIIDPLDGTTNFIHGLPHVAVSIAIQVENRIEHGLIYDPFRDELFSASRGRGAQCNQQRLRITRKSGLEGALIGTGFPFRKKHLTNQFVCAFESIFPVVNDLRRGGSAALDLAYVAASRLDGYWEWGLSIWDVAAGGLIVREAGGMVCDVDGSDNHLQSGNIAAGNSKLLKEMLQMLQNCNRTVTEK